MIKKVPKEEILKLPSGTKYKIYNPLTNTYREEIVSKNDIAHSKYAYEKLEYYIIESDLLKKGN